MKLNREEFSDYLYRTVRPSRRSQIRRVYGLPFESVIDMVKAQEGRCAICRDYLNFERRSWHIDHDHRDRKVRGILCHRCNTVLLPVFDTFPHLIEAAKRYLDRTL